MRGWWRHSLLRLYDSLTLNDSARPVDMIFVVAGRMERKHHGLELYRRGLAPQLLLSVGRFEVSRMHQLGLQGVDQLPALRDNTQPDERHFFVTVDASGTRIAKIKIPRWSTYGEALALRQFLEMEKPRSVMVISTDVHLRRVGFTFGKVFRGTPFEFLYCAVPPRFGFLTRGGWWTRTADRRFVLSEFVKLAGYRAFLSMPAWVSRRLMRLKQ